MTSSSTSSSAQILRGRGVQASFDADAVLLTGGGHRIRIPLAAVQEVRVPGPRSVEIVRTDGARHPVAGANPTATAAFAAALADALPAERDPGAASAVTTEPEERRGLPRKWIAFVAAVLLAFAGYAVVVGVARGVEGVVILLLGYVTLLIGLPLVALAGAEIYRRAVLRRHGITVRAERQVPYGPFLYTAADGIQRSYSARRSIDAINLTYDPRRPQRAAHVTTWPLLLGKLFLLLGFGVLIAGGGCQMSFDIAWWDCAGLSATECGRANG